LMTIMSIASTLIQCVSRTGQGCTFTLSPGALAMASSTVMGLSGGGYRYRSPLVAPLPPGLQMDSGRLDSIAGERPEESHPARPGRDSPRAQFTVFVSALHRMRP